MEGWSNWPKIKVEMQEMCSNCEELQKVYVSLSSKCQIYERQIESQQKIEKLNQVVALLTRQIAEKIAENSMLRVESDANNGEKVEENIIQDIDKFLEIKMNIPNENNKEQDFKSNLEMDNSVFEEAEDEETEAILDEEQELTCAWMVCNDKGTSASCGRVFPSSEDLASHFKKDHLNADLSGIYICRWDGCKRNGKPFKERHNLKAHFLAHSRERPFRWSFEGCHQAFAQMTPLNTHISVHSKSTHPCLDPGCPKVFSNKSSMMTHYRVRHTGERKGFACPVEDCGKVFEFNHILTKHLGSHRPYQCRFPKCYQSFASKQILDEHSEIHGPVAGGHECTFDGCCMKFPNARGLREHVKATHTGETPYVCPYGCGKALPTERGLKMHLKVHSKETDMVESP